jgi:hypothetical protein
MRSLRECTVGIAVLGLLVGLAGCMSPTTPTPVVSGPRVTSVSFPTRVVADGTENTGTIGFTDTQGDIVRVILSCRGQTTGSWDPEVQGQTTGTIEFWYSVSRTGNYTVTVELVDAGGRRSDPYPFSFQADAPPPIPVSAQQLLDEYDANEVAAQLKYQYKQVAVTGYVDSINVNSITGEPYVNLVGTPGEWTLFWVRCTFPFSAQTTLATLHEGDYVTIIGTCTNYILGSVMVDDCHF